MKTLFIIGLALIFQHIGAQDLEQDLSRLQEYLNVTKAYCITYDIFHDQEGIPVSNSSAATLCKLDEDYLYEHEALTLLRKRNSQLVIDHIGNTIMIKHHKVEEGSEIELSSKLFDVLWTMKEYERSLNDISTYLGQDGSVKMYRIIPPVSHLRTIEVHLALQNGMIEKMIYHYAAYQDEDEYTVNILLTSFEERVADPAKFLDSRFIRRKGSQINPAPALKGYEIIDINNLNN